MKTCLALASDIEVSCQLASRQATTQTPDASAPHLVLRFQKSAPSMIGASAAKPEKAKRIASSKMPAWSLSASAIR